MEVSRKTKKLKGHIQAQVEAFFSDHRPGEAHLILDSIGPAITKHYLVLSAIGVKRLHQLREIHAFSGGDHLLHQSV